MSKKDKLWQKLFSADKKFSYLEAKKLLELLGYQELNKGKTSGSRICFQKGSKKILLHRPHGRKELLIYQILQLQEALKGE
ncbi:MAG: type II toxin-antitoxin system HicA family toxin [Lactobacillus sp.]|jgi:hypothetical protein|nr:type II toxin-antitoxin system HicA family toxin [Lactobacillus sp.]MCH3906430.1 type II toxin-antitoxin system HicA family toxin [Lactobacillus sp.]MCH3989995.1 type II toxin-antitoxin system HicA family toxin [Lactobacillus sp.]MCH4069291.1 type II toxin-antitoxin system HicA family toxin [Lactobacillus sp.]MCI1303593.1 type II toxin-antitoxin system HicA family toxin [Lactobacillus sp.]